MSAVFADTFYFLGLLNRGDEAHDNCVQFSRQYRGELLTTEYVMVEVADALSTPGTGSRQRASFNRFREIHGRESSRHRANFCSVDWNSTRPDLTRNGLSPIAFRLSS
jgi:hypothetical protein